MLKIQRKANGKTILTLNGRIDAEDIGELRNLLELEEPRRHIALDLKDVTFVDREAIKFLTDCEATSINLENCPPYVREQIEQQSGRPRRKKRNAPRSSKKKGARQ